MMDTEIFIAAVSKLAGKGGQIRQLRLAKLTGIQQSTISSYVNQKTKTPRNPEYIPRIIKALSRELGLTEPQIEKIGRQKIEQDTQKALAKNNGSMSGAAPAPIMQAQTSNVTHLDQLHWKVVEKFQRKDKALEINQNLVDLEALDPLELDGILQYIEARKEIVAKKQEAERKKREDGSDQGK